MRSGVVASGSGFSRLLQPRTIAVFGGGVAEELVRQCDRLAFAGEVWPVHPKKTEVGLPGKTWAWAHGATTSRHAAPNSRTLHPRFELSSRSPQWFKACFT